MPKNLRHIFRSELIKQRKSGLRVARDAIKKSKDGKYADYRHIYSDNSYFNFFFMAQKFATYCKDKGVKSMKDITPEFAKQYLVYERDKSVRGYSGYSASTIASDALMINHIMIGSKTWREDKKVLKSQIPNMPHRSQDILKQRNKNLTAKEWVERYPHTYNAYKGQITALRAFGIRRRELVGGTSKNGRDGLGDRSLYMRGGHVWAIVQGKGGKIRWTPCRRDLEPAIKSMYGDKIRPWEDRPRNNNDYKHNLKINQAFYKSYSHNVPAHIFRAEYAQHQIQELSHRSYTGTKQVPCYRRAGRSTNGKQIYTKTSKSINLAQSHTIGAYTASYGAFYQLSDYMGHNRLDVLNSYLGAGR